MIRNDIKLFHGDCLDIMKELPDNSIDSVITDPPYGTTACKWDNVIDFELMWKELKRIIKKNGAIVLFGSQPFTSILITSNLGMFKYTWTWEKNFSTNFLHAKRQPLRKTEDIIVFHNGSSYYYPIKTTGHKPTSSARGSSNGKLWHGKNIRNSDGGDTTRYPTNLLKFDAQSNKNRLHPTQKPVDLLEYLIKTYTNKGETVLDFTAGSMSTAIACINTNRKCIMIEKDKKYFDVGSERVKNKLEEIRRN